LTLDAHPRLAGRPHMPPPLLVRSSDPRQLAVHRADGIRLRNPRIKPQRLLVPRPRRLVVRAAQRDVAEAPDAVGLAQDGADAAVQRQRLLEPRPRRLVIRARQRDLAETPDAVGLAKGGADAAVQRQRLLEPRPRRLVVRARKRDVAEPEMTPGLAFGVA